VVRFTSSRVVGAATLTYHAWDQTSGRSGGTTPVLSAGGASAFSSTTATVSLPITLANHAPTWSTAAVAFPPALANDTTPPGKTITELFGGVFRDSNLNTVAGVAVQGLTGADHGTWQYSLNGTTWVSIGTVSASQALLLSGNAMIRFVPDAGFTGTVSLKARAWDGSQGANGGTANLLGTGTTGGGTAFGAALLNATLLVNTAPTIVF
jgi:hypothetical protein